MYKISRGEGLTPQERYIGQICEKTFLSLWSYPGIHRDQKNGTNTGKEVCDLLVVFENHIIIFSAKSCDFPKSDDVALDWGRWYKRAIHKSAEQIWGAERWILKNPDRLFTDPECSTKLPIPLPIAEKARVHRIAVAHGVAPRCKEVLKGSGSLLFDSDISGKQAHVQGKPFTVGFIDPKKGFVHVFDDTTFDIILKTLDTITDFVTYLSEKESLISSGRHISFAGEEDLLAFYLQNTNGQGKHCLELLKSGDRIVIDSGFWDVFINSEERKAQIKEDKASYFWDTIIERLNKHILDNSLYYTNSSSISEIEISIRFLAKEPRFHRRVLSKGFLDIICKTPSNGKFTRVIPSSEPEGPVYIFLVVSNFGFSSHAKYREFRRGLLQDYCLITKLKFPHKKDFIGIATEPGNSGPKSEDLIYFNASDWTEEQAQKARELQQQTGIMTKITAGHIHEDEYPTSRTMPKRLKGHLRNKPCPCGSGIKYKNCCGRKR